MINTDIKQSVLIVDDIPTNIKVLGESLKADYQVRIATNGFKAIEIAMSKNPPDLILLDIMMPGMSGYEVCEKLKNTKQTQNIPIIFITAMDDEKDETKGLQLGAVDYITKPFSLPIVKARVNTHLELKRKRDMLENLSTVDALTGIANRRRFDEHYNAEWKRSVRDSTQLSVIMIDIDYFKLYNDNYGHSEGDTCLKKVSHCLSEIINRPADLLARYGGEEFISILPKTDIMGALKIAEEMRSKIEALKVVHEHSLVNKYITISLGVSSVLPMETMEAQLLVKDADKYLYKAKEEGRNRSCYHDMDLNPGE